MLKSETYGSTERLINNQSDTSTSNTKRRSSRTIVIAFLLLFIGAVAYYTASNATQSTSFAIGANRQYNVEEEEQEQFIDEDIDLEDDKKGGRRGKGGKGGKGMKSTRAPKPTRTTRPPKSTRAPKGKGKKPATTEPVVFTTAPTTAQPTTADPTTAQPTTAQPTTAQATTAQPIRGPIAAPAPTPTAGFSCTTRFGNAQRERGEASTIACKSGETLVSCQLAGSQAVPAGVYGEKDGRCIAQKTDSGNFPVHAIAECCTFPDASKAVSQRVEKINSASCPSNSVITGCDVYLADGDAKQILGSYSGPNVPGTPATREWADPQNECTAATRAGADVYAISHCLSFADGYSLECKTRATWTNGQDGFQLKCEDGYEMMSCNAYMIAANSGNLDVYMDNLDVCYIHQSNNQPMYANAICCQLNEHVVEPPKSAAYK